MYRIPRKQKTQRERYENHLDEDYIQQKVLELRPRLKLLKQLIQLNQYENNPDLSQQISKERSEIVKVIVLLQKGYGVSLFDVYAKIGVELLTGQILKDRDSAKKRLLDNGEEEIVDLVDENILQSRRVEQNREGQPLKDQIRKEKQYMDSLPINPYDLPIEQVGPQLSTVEHGRRIPRYIIRRARGHQMTEDEAQNITKLDEQRAFTLMNKKEQLVNRVKQLLNGVPEIKQNKVKNKLNELIKRQQIIPIDQELKRGIRESKKEQREAKYKAPNRIEEIKAEQSQKRIDIQNQIKLKYEQEKPKIKGYKKESKALKEQQNELEIEAMHQDVPNYLIQQEKQLIPNEQEKEYNRRQNKMNKKLKQLNPNEYQVKEKYQQEYNEIFRKIEFIEQTRERKSSLRSGGQKEELIKEESEKLNKLYDRLKKYIKYPKEELKSEQIIPQINLSKEEFEKLAHETIQQKLKEKYSEEELEEFNKLEIEKMNKKQLLVLNLQLQNIDYDLIGQTIKLKTKEKLTEQQYQQNLEKLNKFKQEKGQKTLGKQLITQLNNIYKYD